MNQRRVRDGLPAQPIFKRPNSRREIAELSICTKINMPFYYGAPDITQYFPDKALIRIDPEDPKVFDKIRDISSSDLCEERMLHILEAKELVLKKFNQFARLASHFNDAMKSPHMPVQTIILTQEKHNVSVVEAT